MRIALGNLPQSILRASGGILVSLRRCLFETSILRENLKKVILLNKKGTLKLIPNMNLPTIYISFILYPSRLSGCFEGCFFLQ